MASIGMLGNREKLPKLVEVFRGGEMKKLKRRQLPVVIDDDLTLIMDVKGSDILSDGRTVRIRELDEFTRMWKMLTPQELKAALQISKSELMHVLSQNVPCVGCRRSVERLYNQLLKYGHLTLEPVVITPDGIITIQEEKQSDPKVLCNIFHDHVIRLARLIENQPKKKKSARCLLHSLESQRGRPLTPVWRDVWDSMRPECKKDLVKIGAPSLHHTLENYLRKHRFCGECKTKVLKAYSLLVEEPEPSKEKGYVASLYHGIKRCIENQHIHLQTETEFITSMINRAEPELIGTRRERHAKTLEIAQEEVLTCLGIYMYERLHRIYMRMREEECTGLVLAAVAVDTLSRSFETAVERKQGYSKLDLLYAELAREEHQKQLRREQKKIKRKRKKGKGDDQDEHEEREDSHDCDEEDEEEEKDEFDCLGKGDEVSCYGCGQHSLRGQNGDTNTTKDKLHCNGIWVNECKCGSNKENKENLFKCDSCLSNDVFKRENGSSSDHSHDCGYSSENNNGYCETGSVISSLSCSPDGSEMACSEHCCNHEIDCLAHCNSFSYGRGLLQPSLQDMLQDHSDGDSDCYISPEEVREFESNSRLVFEKRQELRETLQKRFAQFVVNGNF